MPYWCSECRSYFSVRTGSVLERSKIPLRKWAIAVYLVVTNLKSVSSMKLHRDLGISQKSAWFMLHRLRDAYAEHFADDLSGPVEVDETYVGGKDRNRHLKDRLPGRGPRGKVPVVGIKDRATGSVTARVVERTDKRTVQTFLLAHTATGAKVYTDESKVYDGIENRESVKHSVAEYVRGQAHTNGVESFWSMLKRAHKGTFHKLSAKHLQRYVDEFVAKQNIRHMDTIDQMEWSIAGLVGHRLTYRDLIDREGPTISVQQGLFPAPR